MQQSAITLHKQRVFFLRGGFFIHEEEKTPDNKTEFYRGKNNFSKEHKVNMAQWLSVETLNSG